MILDLISHFDSASRNHSEKSQVKLRRRLIRDLDNLKSFNDQDEYIGKKIEYDQRFYSECYAEFQLMVSSIRK